MAAQPGLQVTRLDPAQDLDAADQRGEAVAAPAAGGATTAGAVQEGDRGGGRGRPCAGDGGVLGGLEADHAGHAIGTHVDVPRPAPLGDRRRPASRTRDTVNILSLESYLRGVVPLEIPASGARTRCARRRSRPGRTPLRSARTPTPAHYEICDTTSCQVYGGYDAEHPSATPPIEATASQGLTYDGRPAFTQFSASSGGWTSAGSVPYLVAQADPYDGWAGNAVHTWTLDVDDATLERHYPTIGDLTSIEVAERDGNGEWGGRVQAMTLIGTRRPRRHQRRHPAHRAGPAVVLVHLQR